MQWVAGNESGDLDEMDKFLKRQKLPKLPQLEVENLHRPVASKESELIIFKYLTKETPYPVGFRGELTRCLKRD